MKKELGKPLRATILLSASLPRSKRASNSPCEVHGAHDIFVGSGAVGVSAALAKIEVEQIALATDIGHHGSEAFNIFLIGLGNAFFFGAGIIKDSYIKINRDQIGVGDGSRFGKTLQEFLIPFIGEIENLRVGVS